MNANVSVRASNLHELDSSVCLFLSIWCTPHRSSCNPAGGSLTASEREGPWRTTLTAARRGNPGSARWTPTAQFLNCLSILGTVSHNQEHLHAFLHRKGKVCQVWKHGWEECTVIQKNSEFTRLRSAKNTQKKTPLPTLFAAFQKRHSLRLNIAQHVFCNWEPRAPSKQFSNCIH